jgi:hypothetical protein
MWTDIRPSSRDYKIGKMHASWYELVIRHAHGRVLQLPGPTAGILEPGCIDSPQRIDGPRIRGHDTCAGQEDLDILRHQRSGAVRHRHRCAAMVGVSVGRGQRHPARSASCPGAPTENRRTGGAGCLGRLPVPGSAVPPTHRSATGAGRMKKNPPAKTAAAKPFRIRLPGFISDEEVGLGEMVTRITSAVGIRPCGGCKRRAAALNHWVSVSGKPRR